MSLFGSLSRLALNQNQSRIFWRNLVDASKQEWDECYELITQLVDKAGKHMVETRVEDLDINIKSNNKDLVTKLDKQLEEMLIKGIRQRFPAHKFIAEESTLGVKPGQPLTEDPTWLLNPIDGTTNLLHGFPYACISVALYINKLPELAIVYNPLLEQRYTARRGKGAFLNGCPIQVSGKKQLTRAIVINEHNHENLAPDHLKIMLTNTINLREKVHALRSLGSAAIDMCLVAQGVADAYFEFSPHAWDVAAGALIVREAGGVVRDPAGGEFDIMSRRAMAAASEELACELTNLLGNNQISHPRDDESAPVKKLEK